MMLLRLSTLATGQFGVRPVVAETNTLLNGSITPIVLMRIPSSSR